MSIDELRAEKLADEARDTKEAERVEAIRQSEDYQNAIKGIYEHFGVIASEVFSIQQDLNIDADCVVNDLLNNAGDEILRKVGEIEENIKENLKKIGATR